MKTSVKVILVIMALMASFALGKLFSNDSKSHDWKVLNERGKVVVTGDSMYYYPDSQGEGYWATTQAEMKALVTFGETYEMIYIGQ